MKGFSSKRIALKVDVIGVENILCARASVHLFARLISTEVGIPTALFGCCMAVD